ncbi:hypothetical protein B5E53_04430 [Eubacterium sp. An11]|uniref:hypothetical protein n=1 Tax=Eubacterium sp. An11 TaxID=1965542 RepID=UPI000B394CA0|nr:hypothetical protein [Eubacterium sp. An11]OUQ68780.1 hypothetical protein B5E53_04430 [Eubacterium sp. An11]
MDEIKKDQKGQSDREEGLSQEATMPDMLVQMRQIFADRDAEYIQMEEVYRKRKESLDAKEVALKETLSGLEDRLLAVTAREAAIKEKETELQERMESLIKEKAALQEAQVKIDKEKTEQWMQVSLLREEARNEKLRSQRLAGEYEEKISKLPADSSYVSALQETAGQTARKQMEEKIAALQGTVDSQKEELEDSKEENRQLKEKNEYLTRANQELEELKKNLPEQQKKDMESLHALAKKLAEEKEALEEENNHLKEDNRRLQEEKGELFKKLMAGTQLKTQDRDGLQEKGEPEEEADRAAFRSTEEIKADDISASQRELEPADVLLAEGPLTAEILQEYLQETGMDARLLHAREGELVAVAAGGLQIMFSFGESPWFDIRKKQKGGWSMKKLLKRYNENKAGLTFIYDENEEELIGSAEFSFNTSPEDLVHKVYQAARIYFGYRNGEEA